MLTLWLHFVLLLALMLLGYAAHAQDTAALEQQPLLRNHVSLELGGNAGIYSLNYERGLGRQVTARVGIEFVPSDLIENGSRRVDTALGAPVMVNFVPTLTHLWGASLLAELGAGVLLTYSSGTEDVYQRNGGWAVLVGTRPFRELGFIPTIAAGFRIYVAKERVAFRAGTAAFPASKGRIVGGWFLWPLVGVGYRF